MTIDISPEAVATWKEGDLIDVRLLDALRNRKQLGRRVKVSREACENAADMLEALAARVAELEAELDKDLSSILKGKPLVEPPHVFLGVDAESYWRLRCHIAEGAAQRSIKMCEDYRHRAIATQRKMDTAADQASDRDKAFRNKLQAAEAKLAHWQAAQHYSYIGRDDKAVLARDLEARAEAAEAKIIQLTAAWGEDAVRVEELTAEVARLRDAGRRALGLLRADGRGDTDIAMSLADALQEKQP